LAIVNNHRVGSDDSKIINQRELTMSICRFGFDLIGTIKQNE